jgi:hypothetical protein
VLEGTAPVSTSEAGGVPSHRREPLHPGDRSLTFCALSPILVVRDPK